MARRQSASLQVWDPDAKPEPEAPPPQMMAPVPPPPPQAPAPERETAMTMLQQSIPAPPGPGWADDQAAQSTMQGLGDRTMGTPMETLRRVFQKQGRVY
jgi:hypothetical protein